MPSIWAKLQITKGDEELFPVQWTWLTTSLLLLLVVVTGVKLVTYSTFDVWHSNVKRVTGYSFDIRMSNVERRISNQLHTGVVVFCSKMNMINICRLSMPHTYFFPQEERGHFWKTFLFKKLFVKKNKRQQVLKKWEFHRNGPVPPGKKKIRMPHHKAQVHKGKAQGQGTIVRKLDCKWQSLTRCLLLPFYTLWKTSLRAFLYTV